MKIGKIHIPIYDFDFTIVDIEDGDNTNDEKLQEVFKENEMRQEDVASVSEIIEKGYKDGGDTYRNMLCKRIVVFIYPSSSNAKRVAIISHEIRHLVDRVMQYCGIDDIESPAYLTGYIYEQLYKLYDPTRENRQVAVEHNLQVQEI